MLGGCLWINSVWLKSFCHPVRRSNLSDRRRFQEIFYRNSNQTQRDDMSLGTESSDGGQLAFRIYFRQ